MKRAGPAGVAGGGNPPAVASSWAPHIWATGAAAPGLWGGETQSAPSPSGKGQAWWPLKGRGGQGGSARRAPVGTELSAWPSRSAWQRLLGCFTEWACVLGQLQLFLGLLFLSLFGEVGDSCSYKARDSWGAGDSWMELASPCFSGYPSWLLPYSCVP
jgi:hypothetical protein